MQCQSCHAKEACIHLTEIVDAVKRTLHLCKECADKHGFLIDPGQLAGPSPADPAALTTPHVQMQAFKLGTFPTPSLQAPMTCPQCGLSWADFKASNRLGCPHDYQVFQTPLQELLLRIHGEVEHRGRAPRDRAARRARSLRRQELQRELQECIEVEAYERAAELRDALRALDAESEGDR